MLYTYVDEDKYVPRHERLLHHFEEESYAGSSLISNPNVKKMRERTKQSRTHRMHICLATDVDVEALKSKESMPWDPTYYFHEHILASLRVTVGQSSNTIEVDPGFSDVVEESDVDLGEAAGIFNTQNAQSLFLPNHSVVTSIKKGLKLAAHRVQSQGGVVFEYTLSNVHGVTDPLEVRNKLRELEGGSRKPANSAWKQDAPVEGFDRSLAVFAEIVSAAGFDASSVFVNYQVLLPATGWALRKGNLSDGVTGAHVPHENFADAEGMMHGTTQAAAPIVRLVVPFRVDYFSRLVAAASFFIICCFAVIMDTAYPIWMLPLLIFLFMIGSGFPVGGVSEAQQSAPCFGDALLDTEFHFNHLISMSFDVKNRDLEAPGLLAASVPTVLLQVYSVGFMGRYVLEGYGYFHLEAGVGAKDVELLLWKPAGSLRANLRDFFIGGSLRLNNNNFVDAVNSHSRTLNKFGVNSVPTGKLRMRYIRILTDPSRATNSQQGSSDEGKGSTSRRTVEDILQTFRASTDDKKFKSSFGGLLGSSVSSRNVLEGSASQSKADRVADILARTRAKIRSTRNAMQAGPADSKEGTANPLHLATLLSEVPKQNRYASADDDDEEDEGSTLIKSK